MEKIKKLIIAILISIIVITLIIIAILNSKDQNGEVQMQASQGDAGEEIDFEITQVKDVFDKIEYYTVRDCINERGLIDKNLLRKQCRDYYKFENAGNLPTLIYNRQPDFLKKPKGDSSKWAKMVYTFENISPYQLLKAKYNGGEPTDRDKRLIENLLLEQKVIVYLIY